MIIYLFDCSQIGFS